MAKSKKSSNSAFSNINLTRSSSDKMVAGVLGGLGKYLNIDSTILRLLWVLLTLFTGFFPGVIAYLIAAVIIPSDK